MNSLFDNRAVTLALSLFLAVLLFYYVRGEFHTRQTINVELNYLKSTRVVPVGNKVLALQVDLRGPGSALNSIVKQKHKIDIDFSQEKPGPLVRGNFESILRNEFPREIVILRIVPREIRLDLEPYATGSVPLELEFGGKLPEGYEITKSTIEPDRIKVAGAQSVVEKMEKLKVGPISLDAAQASIHQELPGLPDGMDYWILDKVKVKVAVQIEEKIVQRTIEVPITVNNTTLKYSVTPNHINLVLEGRFGLIQALAPKDFSAYVEGNEMRAGYYRQAVAIRSPEAVKLVDNKPRVFAIRLWK